ncbi:hypothetical protein NHX12_015250 [Muraenolepis orangiensis]|uniref:Protein N-lysine methyltransferase METTL21A n=1 Tax=Muraenolepis orangiensis TaxID=630683 RepID=A0A9Q0I4C0_9TELE|nr:hypothetical protein NHX12_015250 [Muraenolepis orangiensis]
MALVPYSESIVPALAKLHHTAATFQFAGQEVRLTQDWAGSGVAAVVWDAAVVLCLYLEMGQVEVSGRQVLELGAGTGLVGIVAALLGAQVTLTDRAPALALLSANAAANVAADRAVTVSELTWGEGLERFPAGGYSVVLGADIVYLEDTFPALLRTLHHLCSGTTLVLLACRIRYDRDSRFLEALREGFSVEEVHYDPQRDVHVYRALKHSARTEL